MRRFFEDSEREYSMEKTILTIDVLLDEIFNVEGTAGKATMILFHGSSDCDNFKGKILPGGVDTQKEPAGKPRILSARYILEGKDLEGKDCHIFIENNGEVEPISDGGVIRTKPIIYTDSEALKWMETADIRGTVTGAPGGVTISFFVEDDKTT